MYFFTQVTSSELSSAESGSDVGGDISGFSLRVPLCSEVSLVKLRFHCSGLILHNQCASFHFDVG